ncbi:hypothetical protein OSB04_026919 [Centaurea solstitialis]|uniref:Large ribosomal subunit protein uL10-like insertion domain-containing protein n=1 Tax=Centaurea solstitialis TaxID=347529 RepID=A0AA38SXT6_9ASTR|nr:hypothetical protein OSB04_026919 [Centaurea solstitialis]
MVGKVSKADKKIAYDQKLQILVAAADNVGSNQLQNIGMVSGDIRDLLGCMLKNWKQSFSNLIPLLLYGNVGLISPRVIEGSWSSCSCGSSGTVDVVVPPGNTVLNIPTKINKGTVEIITPVELIKKGDKVGSSEACLLAKLGIRPFSYGLVNGSVFSPEVLDLTEDDLVEKFAMGVSMLTSLALAIHYPTIAAAPHMLINGYKNALAITIETDYSFPLADKVKEYLKDPSKFAVAVPAAVAGSSSSAVVTDAAPAEEKKQEPEEESDDDLVFGLVYEALLCSAPANPGKVSEALPRLILTRCTDS